MSQSCVYAHATDRPGAYWTKRRRFTDTHGFAKPNDERGLMLMDRAAMDVMNEYKDVVLAFGESDEYR